MSCVKHGVFYCIYKFTFSCFLTFSYLKVGMNMKVEIVELVKGAKTNQQLLCELIERFEPLINSYCKKLFFLEWDDAKQELCLAIIESVKSIPYCETDGQCITYITNAVRFKYCFWCKKNMTKEKVEDLYAEEAEELYEENYRSIELRCDYDRTLSVVPEKQKKILLYALGGYSDCQIAEKMGISRQYVNRIKKKLVQESIK